MTIEYVIKNKTKNKVSEPKKEYLKFTGQQYDFAIETIQGSSEKFLKEDQHQIRYNNAEERFRNLFQDSKYRLENNINCEGYEEKKNDISQILDESKKWYYFNYNISFESYRDKYEELFAK
jgi:hypothetical protein